MRVLGIDPGYDRIGLAVMELVNGRETLITSLCLETDRDTTQSTRLKQIGLVTSDIIATHKPDCMAVETLFFNQNRTTALGVAQARGVLLYVAEIAGLKIYEFGPQEVKVAVTGHGKSDKRAVTMMVKQLVPTAPQQALDDEYDAIAVGITCLAHHGRGR